MHGTLIEITEIEPLQSTHTKRTVHGSKEGEIVLFHFCLIFVFK